MTSFRRSSRSGALPGLPFRAHVAVRVLAVALGALTLLSVAPGSGAAGLLFDFGGPESPSGGAAGGTAESWNNVNASVGASEGSEVPNLVDTAGRETAIVYQTVSRFNGANESGATSSGPYPGTATRDSLFGNTELFSSLENLTPAFKLYGFAPGEVCALTFYASRLGVSDNRETRFTVTGGGTAFVDLDASNNVTNRVRLAGAAADAAGEILVEMSPGPNNNNANHFTYLGVLGVERADGARILIDFGAAGSITETQEPGPSTSWNNVPTAVGADPAGKLAGLVTTNGTVTPMALQMVARFNGANLNGTTASTVFPATATQDSLFGNTALFGGLSNVFPAFKLTGLDAAFTYSFTFFGSRTGVTDNRETRYTVRGATEKFADLNTANNVDGVAQVSGIAPDAAGEISVALTAGPKNDNGSRFTYLGVMRVDLVPVVPPSLLVDFGAVGTPTLQGSPGVDLAWNNVPNTLAADPAGAVTDLVRADGAVTGIALRMVSRFNGANENGTTGTAPFPTSATRDSLFGNTEAFSGLENVTPIFKLTGLDPATEYALDFFASRMGVSDIRETRYTVVGAAEAFVDLDAANNETNLVGLAGVRPDAAGELTVSLAPGPNNNNGNHFVYLGVLRVSWKASAPAQPAVLDQPALAGGTFRFRLTGTPGATYRVLGSASLRDWTEVRSVTLTGATATVEVPATEAVRFFQASIRP
jgi:hypothetical protein